MLYKIKLTNATNTKYDFLKMKPTRLQQNTYLIISMNLGSPYLI